MARLLRIAYPGAFYHVMSRGNEQKDVFKSHQTGAIPVVELSVLHGPQHDACVAADGLHPWLFWPENPGTRNIRIGNAWKTCARVHMKAHGKQRSPRQYEAGRHVSEQ